MGQIQRQGHVDPCVNNVEFQGVTIEWSDDDVGFGCQGDNFGRDGRLYYGHDGLAYHGRLELEYYGVDVHENFVEPEVHRM